MKIWLNDQKVKETNHFIVCDKCIFNRARSDVYTHKCLANAFNLHEGEHMCITGYQYEDKV